LEKIEVELSDDMTVGALRQLARALGRELRISFAGESAPAPTPRPVPTAPEATAEPAPAPASEKGRMVAVLEANRWNILKVSKVLGVSRKTLYTRMDRMGIERPRR
jgi:transcriptional regulator of acetoin/glycerol metabolism